MSARGSVAHQPAGFDEFALPKTRRQSVARRQRGKLDAACAEKSIVRCEQGLSPRAPECRKGRIDLATGASIADQDFEPESVRGFTHALQCGLAGLSVARIDQH